MTAFFASDEQEALAGQRDFARAVFDQVVVDLDLAMVDVAHARQPSCPLEYDDLLTKDRSTSDLSCTVGPDCVAVATWTNDASVTDVQILLNGAEVYAGVAIESYTVPLEPGAHELCVIGIGEYATSEPACCTVSCAVFVRGDCSTDGAMDIGDPIRALDTLFAFAPRAACVDACDSNDDGAFDIGDAIYTLSTLFAMGAEPPAPFRACGPDPTEDALDCQTFAPCD